MIQEPDIKLYSLGELIWELLKEAFPRLFGFDVVDVGL